MPRVSYLPAGFSMFQTLILSMLSWDAEPHKNAIFPTGTWKPASTDLAGLTMVFSERVEHPNCQVSQNQVNKPQHVNKESMVVCLLFSYFFNNVYIWM